MQVFEVASFVAYLHTCTELYLNTWSNININDRPMGWALFTWLFQFPSN